jgi:hypothetical protein
MKKTFLAVTLTLLLALPIFYPCTAAADQTVPYFTYSLDKQSAVSGDFVKLKINANYHDDTAAGFRMVISYDAAALGFVRTETSSQIKSGTMVTNSDNNPIISVYVCNTDQATAPKLSGNIITFTFKVNDDIQEGKTVIGAHIDEVCNYQSQQLHLNFDENLSLKVKPEEQLSNKAYLTSLIPQKGTMTPQFSPNVLTYFMQVDNTVNSVEFTATAGEHGTVKINRKTLQKAGTDTAIVATVASADKKATSQYVITVSRAEKPTASAGSAGGTTAGNKTTSRTGGKDASVKPSTEKGATGATGEKDGNQAAEEPASPEDSSDGEAVAEVPVDSPQQHANGAHGDRNIYMIGNQMPTYIVGMLTAALCMMVGIALCLWLKINKK